MAIYYLYKIEINNNLYVGVHSTKNINDGYMGSGNLISKAIKKYGLKNFTKTILEVFDTEDEMYEKELLIVNSEFVSRKDTYNLVSGGRGGWLKSNQTISIKKNNDTDWYNSLRENISLGVRKAIQEGKCKCATKEFMMMRTKKSMLPESIEKRKKTYEKIKYQQKENHNLYGKKAIHKLGYGWMWVDKNNFNEYLENGWNKGKGGLKNGEINGY
jgi:hypothetical protein